MEFKITIGYINEGIKGFKVPQYIMVEFDYNEKNI